MYDCLLFMHIIRQSCAIMCEQWRAERDERWGGGGGVMHSPSITKHPHAILCEGCIFGGCESNKLVILLVPLLNSVGLEIKSKG